jgi:hypothetical protein
MTARREAIDVKKNDTVMRSFCAREMTGVTRSTRRRDRKDRDIRDKGEEIMLFPSPAMTVLALELYCHRP